MERPEDAVRRGERVEEADRAGRATARAAPSRGSWTCSTNRWMTRVPATEPQEVRAVDDKDVVVDLEIDFHNEDATGYVWQWLDAACDPAIVLPDGIIVVGDDDAYAMAQVVDLAELENGTIVHLRILPGSVADYRQAVERAVALTALSLRSGAERARVRRHSGVEGRRSSSAYRVGSVGPASTAPRSATRPAGDCPAAASSVR